jgi:hypothetical protein
MKGNIRHLIIKEDKRHVRVHRSSTGSSFDDQLI